MYELLELHVEAAQREALHRERRVERYGLQELVDRRGSFTHRRVDPMEIRRARQAQLLGTDDYYEKIAEKEARRLRELALNDADPERAERIRRGRELYEAEQAEERRREIARANRSRAGKEEAKTRYGQPRGEVSRKRPMVDPPSAEEGKREHLHSVWRDKQATGISHSKLAVHHHVSNETIRVWLRTWELLDYEHERTGEWPTVAVARRAVMEGARAGDDISRKTRGKPRKRPDLYPHDDDVKPDDVEPDGAHAELAPTPGQDDALEPENHVTKPMIYSQSYQKRHPGG